MAAALTEASQALNGEQLSPDAATLAAASMAGASSQSSVASAADLASITMAPRAQTAIAVPLPNQLVNPAEPTHAEALAAETPDA
jgi:hypothetical protein